MVYYHVFGVAWCEDVSMMGNADSLLQEILSHWEREKYRTDIEMERMEWEHTKRTQKAIERVNALYDFDKLSFLAAKRSSTSALVFYLSNVKP